jgi:hypothetical protein
MTLIFMIFSVLTSGSVFAAGDGGYAGSFLRLGAGARPLGMGGAFTAISDDATALFWNPAGLAQVERKQVTIAYSQMFEGRKQGLLGLACPSPLGTVGLGWMSYGVGGISKRGPDGQAQGEFSDLENTLSLAWAKGTKLGSLGLMAGGNLKFLYQKLDESKATGWGADIGAIARLKLPGLLKRLALGIAVQNLGANLKWDTESKHTDRLPTNARVGTALSLSRMTLAVDIERDNHQNSAYHWGAEYWIAKAIALRTGLDNGDVTAGVSFRLPSGLLGTQLDYGFSADSVSTRGIHRVSVLMGL